jgi:hypothetical protein
MLCPERFDARNCQLGKQMAAKLLATAEGFDDLLRRILIVEKRHRLIDVAAALGMTAHGFCRKLRNGGRFNPDNVATLLRVIADERLPHWFFAGSDLLLVRHPEPQPGSGAMTLHQRAAGCAAQAIAAICELADTLELPMLERRQAAVIERHLDHAQSGLLSIRLQLASPPEAGRGMTDGGAAEDFVHLVRRVLMTDFGVRPHALAGTAYKAILRPPVGDSRIGCSPIHTGLLSLREIVQFLEVLLHADDMDGASLLATAGRHLAEAVRQVAALRWNMTYIGRHEPRLRRPGDPVALQKAG